LATPFIATLGNSVSAVNTKLAIIPTNVERATLISSDVQEFLREQIHPSLDKFLLFWAMMDTIKAHGYTRAAMSVIGRSAIGAWWKLTQHPDYDNADDSDRLRLMSFYNYDQRAWDNIKDYHSMAYKVMMIAMYLRYFGQASLQIVRDGAGNPLGFDFLTGIIIPNVDSEGYFKSPAFVQYPTRDPSIKVEYTDPSEIVYFVNPDWEGSPVGGSDIEALTQYALPIDIYLQTAAREYMKNRNTPEAIYQLPSDISDEAFNTAVEAIRKRYSGASNLGKNPIVVSGEMKIQELSKLPETLPYQASREASREETLSVAGTSGSVLGITSSLASANIRESRRQFHETTMEPLFSMIEQGFYEQVHVREFKIPAWTFMFNSPDFLTAVERATVHMRYIQTGTYSPNDAREEIGKLPREGGDVYVDPTAAKGGGNTAQQNPQGSPPEGRPNDPGAPANTGEPTADNQDPPRGDQHNDSYDDALDDLLSGLSNWQAYAIGRIKKGMKLRQFETYDIPLEIADEIQSELEMAEDVEDVKRIFDEVYAVLEAERYER
jgi:HK97 family phage portal protein